MGFFVLFCLFGFVCFFCFVLFCFCFFGLFLFSDFFGLLIISHKICGFLRVFCVFNVVFGMLYTICTFLQILLLSVTYVPHNYRLWFFVFSAETNAKREASTSLDTKIRYHWWKVICFTCVLRIFQNTRITKRISDLKLQPNSSIYM